MIPAKQGADCQGLTFCLHGRLDDEDLLDNQIHTRTVRAIMEGALCGMDSLLLETAERLPRMEVLGV